MKVFITGITGMAGSEFARVYEEQGVEVFGVARSSAASRMNAIQDKRVIRCDITDREALEKVIAKLKPDLIIHMAAQAFNGMSWDCEYLTHETNYIGTLNVLKCALKNGSSAKVLLACSSAEYGDFDPADCPLKEEMPLRPITPYGVSKVGVEMLGYQYYTNFGLPVYFPRMFIHVGTGHPPATAIQNFARQIALIAKGKAESIMYVGNLTTARDFIDVRDGIAAMMLLIDRGMPGQPVNICTGKAYKIEEILDMLIEIAGLRGKVKIVQDKSLLRASDEPLLLGNNQKILNFGFIQKYTIYDTLCGVYQDWINRI
ncbi:GDP-mannose 4,6-dehydratase [Spirochaetia bacterium]|nr:GDP-mannose 4,6-dehydratase [Spirochaetia bacterium]